MPEMHFRIEWPSGEQQTCYSPSLVVMEYIEVGSTYDVDDFNSRCQTALQIASERVRDKFGFSCVLAQREAATIAAATARFRGQPGAKVKVLMFLE
jgi:uncharacterized repeat protein (TIGR04042 family)